MSKYKEREALNQIINPNVVGFISLVSLRTRNSPSVTRRIKKILTSYCRSDFRGSEFIWVQFGGMHHLIARPNVGSNMIIFFNFRKKLSGFIEGANLSKYGVKYA